jgi:hypothetical protein
MERIGIGVCIEDNHGPCRIRGRLERVEIAKIKPLISKRRAEAEAGEVVRHSLSPLCCVWRSSSRRIKELKRSAGIQRNRNFPSDVTTPFLPLGEVLPDRFSAGIGVAPAEDDPFRSRTLSVIECVPVIVCI